MNAFETKVKSKDDKKEWSTVHMRSGRVVKPLVPYMKEDGTDQVEGALSTIHQHYYTQLCELDDKETKNIEIAAVGAVLGGKFDHTSKLKVMKFKEALIGSGSNKWKE